jgi:phage shock protein A
VKQLLIKLAAVFGMVTARRYESAVKQLEETRASAHAWKERAGEALTQVKSLQGEVQRQSRLLKDARRLVERVQGEGNEGNKLRAQLADTQRQLMVAREQLMAIEVKLDILEGAANVLDARTRTAIRQSTEAGATV